MQPTTTIPPNSTHPATTSDASAPDTTVFERNLCNFVTAAKAVQHLNAEFEEACASGSSTSIKMAHEMLMAGIRLMTEVSPFQLGIRV